MLKKLLFGFTCLQSIILMEVTHGELSSQEKFDISPFFDAHNKPSKVLLNLLSLTKIKHDGSLKNIVEETQKYWLRGKNQERYQISNQAFKDVESKVLPLLKYKLKLEPAVYSTQKHYKGILFYGSTVQSMRGRLSHLVDEIQKKKIDFDAIYFLGSDRPLFKDQETKEVLTTSTIKNVPLKSSWKMPSTLPTTEHEAMKWIIEQTDLPQKIIKAKKYFLTAPMKPDEKGLLTKRPTTKDAFVSFLNLNPSPGVYLAISNQPFREYQQWVGREVLSKKFILETVGSKASKNTNIGVYLDNAARILYQKQIVDQKVKNIIH
jgi:hypothetical protein